jgi:SRR1
MEWQVVKKKSRSRIRSHKTGTISAEFLHSYYNFNQRISECKKKLSQCNWVIKLADTCSDLIVAVGLGNFSCSEYSISQHSLYEYLIDQKKTTGELYDPSYTQDEVSYLQQKKFIVNEGVFDKQRGSFCTYLMIHCHYTLYERLLSNDWIDSDVLIIGNSITDIKNKFTSIPAMQKAEKYSSVLVDVEDLGFHQVYINRPKP